MGKRQGGGSRDGVDLGKGRPGRGLAGDKGRSWLTGTPGTRVPPHPQTSAEGPEVGCSSRRRKRGLLCKLHSTAGTPGPLASGSCCRCLGAVESTWVQDTGQGGMRQQHLPGLVLWSRALCRGLRREGAPGRFCKDNPCRACAPRRPHGMFTVGADSTQPRRQLMTGKREGWKKRRG